MCGRYTLRTRRSDDIQAELAETLGVEAPEDAPTEAPAPAGPAPAAPMSIENRLN